MGDGLKNVIVSVFKKCIGLRASNLFFFGREQRLLKAVV